MIDTTIVAAYLGLMLLVGWRSRRQSAESYWVAERRYSSGPITLSLTATVFGASSTMGIIGLGYSRGLTAAWWSLVGAMALVPFGLVLAERVRRLEVYTLPDILRRAYGNRVAVPAAVLISIAWCGVVAAQLVAAARLLSGITPLEYSGALTLVAAVFVLYTYWGGQLSVIRTDSVQLLLFVGGLAICAGLVLLSGGGALGHAVPAGYWSFPVSDGFRWYDLLVFYPLIVGLPYLVGPDIYTRMLCARDGAAARRAALWGAAAIVPISFLLALLGMMIRGRFPGLAPDAALPAALNGLAPAGLAGLIAAGFLAAVMSSADTTLISAATILSLNVLGARGNPTRARQLALTRLSLVAVGIVGWAIANFQGGIIPALLLGYTVFVGGVVLPALASFWRERLGITPTVAMAAVVVGGSAALLGAFSDGELLRGLLGAGGDRLLQGVLGARYPAILPVVLCFSVLAVGGAVRRLSGKGERVR